MATDHPPLQERVHVHNTTQRTFGTIILSLLLTLLAYRLTSLSSHGTIWLVAFLAECWFTFIWLLYLNAKWSPVMYKTYPEHLNQRFDDLPSIDMFVTTADSKLEPPIITVNTVLSLLAADYPAHKLACYVSDDGGSPTTFYALSEAAKFAVLWVPFCKRYNIGVRAPFVYFSSPSETLSLSDDFIHEWKLMKSEYNELNRKIELFVPKDDMYGDLAEFSKIETGNHDSIIKVLWENREIRDGTPHLVYVAREKSPKQPHNYKAGAMNVLTRVSGVMTNAPFMLNVDCDMFVNNPKVLLHGMCLLLGFDKEMYSGFVQTMQQFYGSLKDDPFGNQLVVLQRMVVMGMGGIQGPFYGGTGCFHRRKAIYGSPPREINETNGVDDELSYEELQRKYGNHVELIDSASRINFRKDNEFLQSPDLSSRVEAAKRASTSTYEQNTCWGKEIGWVYGSTAEDVLTGLKIHAMGWRSVFLIPDPPAFLGSAPVGGPSSLTQYKRWATGLLEVLFVKNNPIFATLNGQLMFRQFLAYLVINVWALRSAVELCYALIPAYCLLVNTSFLPKASEPGVLVPISIFILFNFSNLREYQQCGLSFRTWWNNQRMQRISSLTAWLFGLVSVVLKIFGLSETAFEVTRKDQNSSSNDRVGDPGRFTFDSSSMFVPVTAVVLVHMLALATGLLRVVVRGNGTEAGLGEFVCSGWFLLSFLPFVRGLFARRGCGIPWSVVLKAGVMVTMFLHLCRGSPISSGLWALVQRESYQFRLMGF